MAGAKSMTWSIEHLRKLILIIPENWSSNPLIAAQVKTILLFIHIIEAEIAIYSVSEVESYPTIKTNVVLIRVDLKRNHELIKVISMDAILRFLHGSERSDYSLYPLYPLDRANVDSTMVMLHQAHAESSLV